MRVHCAALVSAWLSADDGDHGKLLLGLWQCNEALREADRADVVIAALHHPWSYMAEWDLAACQAEIERNAGLVLRGHLHEARHDYRRARATAACSSWRPGRATRTASIPTAIISSRCATQPGGRRRLHRGAMRQRARDQIPDTRGGHAVKDEIRSILIEIARQRGTIAYSELVQKVRTARLTPGSPELAAMLGELSSEEDAAGRGMLSALVVSKSDRKPGAGFFSLARELGRDTSDRQHCWNDELQELYRQWSR